MTDDNSKPEAECEAFPAATCSMPAFVETAFIFAARYTHHRHTGGTLAVTRALSYVWPELSARARQQILDESNEATANLDDWATFRDDLSNAEAQSRGTLPQSQDPT